MKHLSSYKEVEEICKKYKIRNWSIGKDGLVNVNGNVNLEFKDLEKLPLNFGKVSGNFSCGYNKLTNLEGAPKETHRGFYCNDNELITLEGAPKEVGGDFHCYENKLTDLKSAPRKIGDDFDDFLCHNNKLTTLEGSPKKVSGDFYCNKNKLTSLKEAPKKVGDDFSCRDNKLTTLEGIPFHINRLNSFANPIYEIWKFIDDVKYLQEFVEVYDVVRPDKVVILEYLNDIRKLMGKKPVEREEIPDDWEILDI